MECEQDLILLVLDIPEYHEQCLSSFERLSKVIYAQLLQQNESLPFIEDLDSVEILDQNPPNENADNEPQQATSNSADSSRNISFRGATLARIRPELIGKTDLSKRLPKIEKERKPFAIVIPKGDLNLKQLEKNLGKVHQMKDKQIFQLIFLGPDLSPLLDRNEPQNTKTALKFLNLNKCQAVNEEECLKEFMKHIAQSHI